MDVKLVLFARQLVKILGRPENSARASTAATYVQDIQERSMRHNFPDDLIASAKGCHFCCQNFVSASAPQVFLLADHIQKSPAFSDKLNAIFLAEDQTRSRSKHQRAEQRLPCALLVDGAC
ncbi:MAG: hypothetical protein JKY92_01000 [Magnetovibrio sp.]|nr:hypothetical protein [Magnetovibrio sp.]